MHHHVDRQFFVSAADNGQHLKTAQMRAKQQAATPGGQRTPEGGFIVENLFYTVSDQIYSIKPMNARLYQIMNFLKGRLEDRPFTEWKKIDRDEQLFPNEYKFKQIKRYVTGLRAYFLIFKYKK